MKNLWMLALGLFALSVCAQAGSLSITVQQDFTHMASAVIDQKGGQLKTQAADGTQFTLTIPADALGRPIRINLIPIGSQAKDFPFHAGISSGVNIEPEGLILDHPAQLDVTLTKDPNPKTLTAFAYHEDGVDFGLYPMTLSGRTLTYKLEHFSGYGNGDAAPGEAGAVPPPSTPQDQSTQSVTQLVNQCRASGCDMSSSSFQDAATQDMAPWGNYLMSMLAGVDQLGQAGATLDEGFDLDLLHQCLAWQHQAQLLGLDTSSTWKIMMAHATSILQALGMQKMKDCWNASSGTPIAQILGDALALGRQAELLGINWSNDPIMSKAFSCLQFDVTFKSGLSIPTNKGTVLTQIEGKAHVIPNQGVLYVDAGGGDFSFTEVQMPAPGPCTYDWSHTHFNMDFQIRWNLSQATNSHSLTPVRPGRPVAPPPSSSATPDTQFSNDIQAVFLTTHSPLEMIKIKCAQLPQPVPYGSFWQQFFDLAHSSEKAISMGLDSYGFQNWTSTGGAPLTTVETAQYAGSTAAGSVSINEVTEIDVIHAPAGTSTPTPPGPTPPVHVVNPPTEADILSSEQVMLQFIGFAASGDERFLDDAYSGLANWIPRAQAFGDKFQSNIQADTQKMIEAYQAVVNKWAKSCKNTFDNVSWLAWINDWLPGKTLITGAAGYDPQQLNTAAQACSQFKFSFNTHLVTRAKPGSGDATDGTLTFDGALVPSVDLPNHRITLTSMFREQFNLASYVQGSCSADMHGTPGQAGVTVAMGISTATSQMQVDVQSVDLDLGQFFEDGTIKCGDQTKDLHTPMVSGAWAAFHMGEATSAGGKAVYRSTLWVHQRTAASFATKDYSRQMQNNQISEETHLKLIPGQ